MVNVDKQLSIYHGVIDYLNLKAGRRYKVTVKHRKFITARLNEGYQYDDFTQVIDNMVREWANDPVMYKYLRPETLFGNKFDGYLNMIPAPPKKHPSGIQPAQPREKEAMRAKIEEQCQFAKSELEDGESRDRDWLSMVLGTPLMKYSMAYGDDGLDPKYQDWYAKTWLELEDRTSEAK